MSRFVAACGHEVVEKWYKLINQESAFQYVGSGLLIWFGSINCVELNSSHLYFYKKLNVDEVSEEQCKYQENEQKPQRTIQHFSQKFAFFGCFEVLALQLLCIVMMHMMSSSVPVFHITKRYLYQVRIQIIFLSFLQKYKKY